MIGTTLSQYRILEKIGEGGMGEVYLAEDTSLKRKVALKVLPAEMAADPERLARFKREAESVAALNHPNIVTIHSVEEVDGTHFLTMEWVDGQTLGQLMSRGAMPLEKLFALGVPIADALASAHEEGITHRDLKPANVMVTEKGRVKVLDFGLAKLALEGTGEGSDEQPTQALTQEGLAVGTVPYMSPEQVRGEGVDHRTDIFSLGVVLYEMASGERPFGGKSSADLVSAILRDRPPSVTEV
ncbi:MAG: serine/threonine-protein kinase, partial [Thermoanaerobaculia bacterium]